MRGSRVPLSLQFNNDLALELLTLGDFSFFKASMLQVPTEYCNSHGYASDAFFF
jgi:hypothetical protein